MPMIRAMGAHWERAAFQKDVCGRPLLTSHSLMLSAAPLWHHFLPQLGLRGDINLQQNFPHSYSFGSGFYGRNGAHAHGLWENTTCHRRNWKIQLLDLKHHGKMLVLFTSHVNVILQIPNKNKFRIYVISSSLWHQKFISYSKTNLQQYTVYFGIYMY